MFVPQNTSLNRQENQWTGLFKQFKPTHLSEDRSFHYAMVGMLASPFVAMGVVEGGAAAWYGIEAQALRTIGNAALKYWAHAPAIGKVGMNVAEFLDESGSVGAQNSGVTFRATEVLTSSFRHIFSSKHLKKGLEVFGNSDGEILRKVESIIKSNIKNLKEGDNFIETTINGVKGTVKTFVEKSDIKSVNDVKGEYERKYNNVIQDINSN